VTLLSRLPLRRRVTGTFTLAAAAVLAVLGVYLHVRLVHQLDDQIASALQQRRQDVTALLGSDPQQGFAQLEQRDVNGRGGARDTTQLLSSTGEVLASEGAPDSPLLTEDQITQARDGKSSVIVAQGRGPEDRIALLAGPVTGGVVVVGASLDQHDNAVHELDRLLLVGLPAALLLAALAGLWGSRIALAPVDRMRERAEFVGFANPEERLPEPVAKDELQRLARTLNSMLDRLQHGYARERAFVDDAAHELRTPLTMLRGELELAETRPRSAAELEATVHSARRQTERLVALANDLLILARSADGQLPLRREHLEVLPLLEAAALRARARARDRPIAAAPEASDSGAIDADRLRIEQALDNLVANALDHGAGRVLLGAERLPDAVLLTVDDDGPGIDPAVAQRAFDRFARGDAARSGAGTGLGLAIVRAIVSAHGGTAGLEPRPDGGTRAWLRLPHPNPSASA
jgi:two-component system OmpR family sensor kinase